MNRYWAIMIMDDDAITFVSPDLPGFSVQADTTDPDAAVVEAEAVLSDYLGAMLDAGRDLPAASDFLDAARESKRLKLIDPNVDRTASVLLTGRPVGGPAQRINITIDTGTLKTIEAMRKARRLSRSAYLAEAARAYG